MRTYKFVWKRSSAQKIGNRQVLKPVTIQTFKKEVLPLTRKGYYKGKTTREKYSDFKRKEPNTYISYVDSGEGYKVRAVDNLSGILGNIRAGREKGWNTEVNSFKSKKAKKFMQMRGF